MKVLLVYTNTYRAMAPLPLGAALVADRLRRDGHTVRLLDLMFARSATAAAARATREFAPDLVGFSLRNVDNQSPGDLYDPLRPPPRPICWTRASRPTCASTSRAGGNRCRG